MELVTPSSLVEPPLASGDLLKNRAKDWLGNVSGVTESMLPAMASASLLAGPWLEPGTWEPGIPSACFVLHETAATFTRPRVLEFSVEPSLIATKTDRVDVLTGTAITTAPLNAKLTASRTAETLKAEFFDDALFGATGGVGPYVVASNERSLEESFDAANMRVLLETSGTYEVRGFAELAGGVRSEYERRQVEVDNDAPTVTLLPVTETTTGVFDLKGSIADKNLSSWQVYWRPASGAGSWTALPGYGGTYQLAGSGQVIASIDSKALGWNGSLRLAVVAEDKARNQTLAETTITFENDSWKPLVSLTGTIAGGAPLTDGGTLYGDETTLNFTASDDPTPKVSGIRLAKLWAESQSDPTRVLVLYDGKFNPPAMGSVPTPATPITLSTKSLPRTSPVEKWTVHAEAWDDAGNPEEKTIRNLSVGDLIWDFTVSPGAISKGGKGWTELKCQMSTPATWAYEIRQVDVATGQALPPILWTSSSNGLEQTLGIDYWYGVKSGDSREAVPSGVYEVTVRVNKTSRPEEIRKARVTVVPTSFDATDTAPRLVRIDKLGQDNLPANEGVSSLVIPEGNSRGDVMTDLVIRKGSGEKLQITGRLGTFAIAALDGSTKGEELPSYKYPFGYSDAFWAVEFKSSDAFPAMEDILANRQDGVTITNRDNWIPVRWETGPITPPGCPAPYDTSREACLGNQPVVLAEWNASELPLGYYDLRLWVTNGLLSVHHVVGGFKVVPAESGTTDGPGIENVGALTLSSTDLTVPFSGYSAQIARDYNSRDVYNDGPLGYGWKMRGLNLKVETYGISGDEDDEAFITLPDGREFWFANMPPKQDVAGGFNASAQNRWILYGEYLQRPYGMRLFRPGASNWFHNSGPFSAMRVAGDGYQMGAGAGSRHIPLDTYVDPENNNAEPYGPGDVAYLQTEDKTWYIFVWETGDLIEMIHPDGQVIRFERNTAEQANPATGLARTMVVRDTAGKTMTILRDTTTGRIEQVLDPNSQPVKYSYDPHGNLREVIDRRGFRRFYVYDTPTDRDFFKRNFPNEMAKFTGRHLHRLVDVRIDDDSDALMHFEGDTFPPAANANGDLRVYTQQLLGSQQWPGDRSILTFKYDGNDDIVAYETSAGNVDLSYNRDEDGGTVDIVQRESQGRQRVTYNKDGRVTEKVDLYGAKSINNYGVADFGDNGTISGVLKSEENALHQVTAYDYEGPTQRGPGSFSEIFQGFLDSKLSGDCPTLYGPCPPGEYFPQNAPGYLTGAQLQPSVIRQQGANGLGGDDIVNATDYQMNGEEPAAFQPLKFVDPLHYTGNIQGDIGTSLAYSPSGKMTTVTPLGDTAKAVTSEYYGDTTMADPVYTGEAAAAFRGRVRRTTSPQEAITEYGYRLSPGAGTWAEERAVRIVTPGQPTRYTYTRLDALGRTVESWDSTKGPAEGYLLSSNQENRYITQYDPNGNILHTQSADGAATSNLHDWQGRIVRTVSTPGVSASQRGGSADSTITTYAYDDFGRQTLVKTIELPADQIDESKGRLVARSEYLYQELPLGRTPEQPLLGRLETVKDLRGGRTETQYDKGGRIVAFRSYLPDGTIASESSSEYDLLGRQTKSTDERGNTTETVYDDFGRISLSKRNGVIVGKYGYDKGGRQIWTWTQVGGYTINKYDSQGRVVEVHVNQASGSIESLTDTTGYTSDNKMVFTYEESGLGRRIAETDQEGRTTRTYYDAQGRVSAVAMAFVGDVTSSTPPTPDLINDPEGDTNAVFKFGYDAEGRQNRIEKPLGGVTEKFYDANGRLEYEFGPINTDSSTGPGANRRGVKQTVYTKDGQIERQREGTASNGTGAPVTRDLQLDEEVVYTYDADFGGVATKSLLRNGALQRTETYSYGREYGELIAVKVEEGGGSRTTGYSYDANGNLDMVTSPEGWTIYERDALGDLRRIRTSTGIETVYTYTNRGQIKTISDRGLATASDETGTVSYGYDEFGRKESITRSNGTTSEYTYDPLTGWTESITHNRGGNVLLALGYDRDKTGLITDIAETRPAGEQSGAWHYDYDTLKRLYGATWTPTSGTATAYGYSYDRNGNRLSESVSGSATKYSRYNMLDQLLDERTSAAYPGGTIEKSYAWDTHGRLASETASIASASRVYTWSVDDRLESVQLGANPTDPTVRYTYDHESRLIKREQGQDVARFLVDNDNPTGYSQALSEVSADATKVTENYFYGDEFGPLAQIHNPGAVGFEQRFLYGDHLSTTRLLTTSLPSDEYTYYSPFGAMTQPAGGSSLTRYAFTGQFIDLDTGLQHHRARWLSCDIGRWLSEDPVFDWPGNFGNGYGYSAQEPIGVVDLSGRDMSLAGTLTTCAVVGTLVLTGLAALIPFMGVAYMSSQGRVGFSGVMRKLRELETWVAAVLGLFFGYASGVVTSAIATRLWELVVKKLSVKVAEKVNVWVAFIFSILAVVDSIKMTMEMVNADIPIEETETVVAIMTAGIILSAVLFAGNGLRKVLRKKPGYWDTGSEHDADYWELSAENRSLYDKGQAVYNNEVFAHINKGTEGMDDIAAAIQRGKAVDALKAEGTVRVGNALTNMAATVKNSGKERLAAYGFGEGPDGMTFRQWLATGATPQARMHGTGIQAWVSSWAGLAVMTDATSDEVTHWDE
jgi:RHS repeat-associated protein